MYKNKNTINLILFAIISALLTSSIAADPAAAVTTKFEFDFKSKTYLGQFYNFIIIVMFAIVLVATIALAMFGLNKLNYSRINKLSQAKVHALSFSRIFTKASKRAYSKLSLRAINAKLAKAKSRIISSKTNYKVLKWTSITSGILSIVVPIIGKLAA